MGRYWETHKIRMCIRITHNDVNNLYVKVKIPTRKQKCPRATGTYGFSEIIRYPSSAISAYYLHQWRSNYFVREGVADFLTRALYLYLLIIINIIYGYQLLNTEKTVTGGWLIYACTYHGVFDGRCNKFKTARLQVLPMNDCELENYEIYFCFVIRKSSPGETVPLPTLTRGTDCTAYYSKRGDLRFTFSRNIYYIYTWGVVGIYYSVRALFPCVLFPRHFESII